MSKISDVLDSNILNVCLLIVCLFAIFYLFVLDWIFDPTKKNGRRIKNMIRHSVIFVAVRSTFYHFKGVIKSWLK